MVLGSAALLAAPQNLLRSGLEAMNAGKMDAARRDLEVAAQRDPQNPQVCLALTQVYARLASNADRDATAQRCAGLAHVHDRWQASGAIRDYLGKLQLAEGQFDAAVAEYREAIRLEPYEEQYRFDLAQAMLGRERFGEAVEVLAEAQKVFDKSAQIELALGVAYYGERRFGDAADAFLRTIQLAPDVLQPYLFLGKMLDQVGERLPAVARDFVALQQRQPDQYAGYLLQAKALAVASGDSVEREKLLRRAIALADQNSEAHYELGVLLESERQFEGAQKELERSAQLKPSEASTHYHLARVYDRLNKPEAAARERELHQALTGHEKVTAGMER